MPTESSYSPHDSKLYFARGLRVSLFKILVKRPAAAKSFQQITNSEIQAQSHNLGVPQTGLLREKKQRTISATEPRGSIRLIQQRVDLGSIEEVDERTCRSFRRGRADPLDQR